MHPFYKAFGRRLRENREERKLTQAELAERVGLKRSSIANIETGRQRLPLHMLFELARALGVEAKVLLPLQESASIWKTFQKRGHGEDIAAWAQSALGHRETEDETKRRS